MRASLSEDGMTVASFDLPLTPEQKRVIWKENGLSNNYYMLSVSEGSRSWTMTTLDEANALYFKVKGLKDNGLLDKFMNWLEFEDSVTYASALIKMDSICKRLLGKTFSAPYSVNSLKDDECERLEKASGYAWEAHLVNMYKYGCNHGFVVFENNKYHLSIEDRLIGTKDYDGDALNSATSIGFNLLFDTKEELYDFLRKNAKLEKELGLVN